MAEDLLIGFNFFFQSNDRISIADDVAVQAASGRLFNETARNMAFDHLAAAVNAVQEAAKMKAARDSDGLGDFETPDLNESSDFFL